MIDALFGSKTRVKLLHLFLNNPGTAFYVREITRLIDEQINSVRRELSNMLNVGIITSNSADNKLYYEVNQKYEYYNAFRDIFVEGGTKTAVSQVQPKHAAWRDRIEQLQAQGLRVAVAAGALVPGSPSKVDLMLVGTIDSDLIDRAVSTIEKKLARSVTYTVMSQDEFYYRLSVRDKFVREILRSKHVVIVDTDDILKED